MQAWRIEISVDPTVPDPAGAAARRALAAEGLELRAVQSRRGFLVGHDAAAPWSRDQVEAFVRAVLADPILDRFEIWGPGETPPAAAGHRVSVLRRPGVTDPVAHSVQKAMADAQLPVAPVATYRVFAIDDTVDAARLRDGAARALANDVIEEVLVDAVPSSLPGPAGDAPTAVEVVAIRSLGDDALTALSREGGLALTTEEMQQVQAHYRGVDREPTRMELETIAQTWSEHCKHKTLTGDIEFTDADGTVQHIDNLLRSTIAHVTRTLDRDFCLSVFVDNAGVIRFDDDDAVCIKVETHNHPSAIEPFGGAGTGVGGVIRDVLGTGLGARPIASTDVFCFAPPDQTSVPEGCLPPGQILRGVVAGVRDYGNPMGIPTVNGSVHFDPDFVGNPLVYVGNIGILPQDKIQKQAHPGDVIVSIGGRTGRDGIHGATFSSLELHSESEMVSSGAVQIGDPITERKAMDAVLRARDEGLFTSITDCGAGGFSSAVGEMAEHLGAEVDLDSVPLKYEGLAPWEIWISEAQERMVLAVPERHLARLRTICDEEDAEITALGHFTDSGRLVVRFGGEVHMDVDLEFLHDGLPKLRRRAVWAPPALSDPDLPAESDLGAALLAVLGDYNVASKEWIIRQYDHEVQAGSAGKPLVGVHNDGPADAAVIAPKLGSMRGIVLSNGLNPRYSRIDPAAMAECALDEAMRNAVATGADPDHTAILDNYCWANTAVPERLGELVRASYALRDLALAYGTPFVSGKDSLNNEFRDGDRTITIPGCILVTAMSVIPDVRRTVSSDLKAAGDVLVLVGVTRRELGGSVYWKNRGHLGASVPRVDAATGKAVLVGVARAIQAGAVRAAHDLSEGGLAAAVAEMCIGGRLGAQIDLDHVRHTADVLLPEELAFSESQSRILLAVPAERLDDVTANLHQAPHSVIGTVTETGRLTLRMNEETLADIPVADLVAAWKRPLDLDGTLVKEAP